jgi:hypothetical protein
VAEPSFKDLAYQVLGLTVQNPNQQFAQSIAPYGLRYSDVTTGQPPVEAKGKGFFGEMPTSSGSTMTELSTTFDINGQPVSVPLVVPTLSAEEIDVLVSGQQPTEGIYQKAYAHAMDRMQKGLSPFAESRDLRIPAPQMQKTNETNATRLSGKEENQFQSWVRGTDWFSEFTKEFGEEPDLNTPDYDYRAAWKAGIRPERDPYDKNRFHWASSTGSGEMLKSAQHPTAWKEYFMRETGLNPDAVGIATEEEGTKYINQLMGR